MPGGVPVEWAASVHTVRHIGLRAPGAGDRVPAGPGEVHAPSDRGESGGNPGREPVARGGSGASPAPSQVVNLNHTDGIC